MAGRFADDGVVDTIARHYVGGRPPGPGPRPRRPVRTAWWTRPSRWALEAARRAEHRCQLAPGPPPLHPGPRPARRRRRPGRAVSAACLGRSPRPGRAVGRARGPADAAGGTGRWPTNWAIRAGGPMPCCAWRRPVHGPREFKQADEELAECAPVVRRPGRRRAAGPRCCASGAWPTCSAVTNAPRRSPIAAALDAFRAVGDRRGEALVTAEPGLDRVHRRPGRAPPSATSTRRRRPSGRRVTSVGLAWVQGLSAFVKFQQGDFDTAGELSGPDPAGERTPWGPVRRGHDAPGPGLGGAVDGPPPGGGGGRIGRR